MKKLSLKQLKVESFVTKGKNLNANTVKGGLPPSDFYEHDEVPVDYDWVLGSRGGCSRFENMC